MQGTNHPHTLCILYLNPKEIGLDGCSANDVSLVFIVELYCFGDADWDWHEARAQVFSNCDVQWTDHRPSVTIEIPVQRASAISVQQDDGLTPQLTLSRHEPDVLHWKPTWVVVVVFTSALKIVWRIIFPAALRFVGLDMVLVLLLPSFSLPLDSTYSESVPLSKRATCRHDHQSFFVTHSFSHRQCSSKEEEPGKLNWVFSRPHGLERNKTLRGTSEYWTMPKINLPQSRVVIILSLLEDGLGGAFSFSIILFSIAI